ncbi:mechanosensitive ion channel family protein [Rhodococcus rhodnii]|uniref:Uncharacterized protein n=2 Tax=Rhodococcus rhodnii TaxID=38312 RepID=R7WQ74_9NOCA|nr:mechanosensitive ion channel domain-containing protein [Rhodococcus rhodnii]EOM77415.1 hypothetical protein Rrhod_1221 [Rhodococcus rhodnii LMG 5362]TXG90631.1 mechanosensitive ion channel family protein [Rhodococcus rhodnii]
MVVFQPVYQLINWITHTGANLALIVVGGVLVARFVQWAGGRITERIDAQYQHGDALVRSEAAKHRHSVAQVITWVVITLVWIVVILRVLDVLNLPIGSLVAPATVLGAALGFGAQRVVQDILAGFFIITERQYGFGDTVRLAIVGASEDAEGVIEDVTLRVTRMRNSDGEVITVPNGQIVKATNLSKDWARAVVDVPVPSTVDINKVNEVLHQVCIDAYTDRSLKRLLLDEPTVMGIEKLGVDETSVRLVARTLPGKQFQVGRALRVRIATATRRQGIVVSPDVQTQKIDEEHET